MLLKEDTDLKAHGHQVEAVHDFEEPAALAQGLHAGVMMILLGE